MKIKGKRSKLLMKTKNKVADNTVRPHTLYTERRNFDYFNSTDEKNI